jgi:hypothetical protein
MSYIKKSLFDGLTPARRSEFLSLLDGVPGIARALDAGGWICGGFVRHLLLDLPIADYFFPKEGGRPGDVDIFFSNQDDANRAAGVAALKGNGCDCIQTSWGGFAKEMTARFNRRSVIIQFVNHPDKLKPTVEETLDRFDFLNCKVAISREGLVIAEGWREVEDMHLLKICDSSSPFLGSRILKYLTHKGLNELTEDSQPLVTEWLLSASLKRFEGSETKHLSGLEFAIKTLHANGHVKREDLLFFIGKYQEHVQHERYGPTVTFDWALKAMVPAAD